MTTSSTRHTVYHVLHRPMLWCGVDRKLFVGTVGGGLLAWNLTGSLLAGFLIVATLYACAVWATRTDPQMVQILLVLCRGPHRHGFRFRTTFDPLAVVPVHLTVQR